MLELAKQLKDKGVFFVNQSTLSEREINISTYMPPFDVLVMKDTIYGFAGSRQISAPRQFWRSEDTPANEWATRAVDILRNTLKDRFPSVILFIGDIKAEQNEKKDAAPAMKFYTKTDVDIVEVLQYLLIMRGKLL